MSEQLQALATTIEQIIIILGYFGIILLMFADQWILPLPAALILGFAGFATVDATTQLSWGLVLLASTFGSVIGALSIYLLVRRVNADRIWTTIDRYGRWMGLTQQRLHTSVSRVEHTGILLTARFVPALRTLISWPAGMSHVGPGRFLWTTVLGCSIFNSVMIYGGRQLKSNWRLILTYVQQYEQAVLVALVALAFGWMGRWIYIRHTHRLHQGV